MAQREGILSLADMNSVFDEISIITQGLSDIQTWQQSRFIPSRKFKGMPEEWHKEQEARELCLVRASREGNAICQTFEPGIAVWIAERLNLASILCYAALELRHHQQLFEQARRAGKEVAFDNSELKQAEERIDRILGEYRAKLSEELAAQSKSNRRKPRDRHIADWE